MARLTKWGKKPGGNWFSVVRAACDLYSVTSEPGIMRVESGGDTNGLFDQTVAFPRHMAHALIWDFKNAYEINTTNVWTEVTSGSGTSLTVQDARGGVARIANQASTNDAYYYYVSNYEPFAVSSGKHAWFFTTIKLADATCDFFCGLCAKVSAANALFDARVNSIGFYMTGGTTTDSVLYAECKKTSATQTSTGFTLTDATEACIGFHVVSNEKVLFFAGNSPKTLQFKCAIGSTYIPTTELAIAFGVRNYGKTVAQTLDISSIKLLMDI